MPEVSRKVSVLEDVQVARLPPEVLEPTRPVLLRGLVRDWPAVRASRQSAAAAANYLRGFYVDATVNAVRVDPRHHGRVFYNEDLTGFNYETLRVRLDSVLDELQRLGTDPDPATLYVGSTTVDTCLPGFRAENDIRLGDASPLVSIWLGNRSRVAAHFDLPDNIACCVAGRRRFTLFPPGEIDNLYPGPIDFTPAGQTISMVDFHAPDLERFPRFAQALENAQLAELEPGDALVIPSLWWHHVEAADSFNVLINYWWRRTPLYMDPPANVLDYALLALRDLPARQRAAWHDIFRYYVFEFEDDRVAHLPADRRGVLGPLDEGQARRLRAQIRNRLNR
ncbi:MAG: cupin-like domain-containing protein [Lysobacterales bacterium]